MARTKEEKTAYDKEWMAANPEKRRAYKAKWLEQDIILPDCGCGAKLTKQTKTRHGKTKAHLGWMQDGIVRFYEENGTRYFSQIPYKK